VRFALGDGRVRLSPIKRGGRDHLPLRAHLPFWKGLIRLLISRASLDVSFAECVIDFVLAGVRAT
jgi:hypothetical protein